MGCTDSQRTLKKKIPEIVIPFPFGWKLSDIYGTCTVNNGKFKSFIRGCRGGGGKEKVSFNVTLVKGVKMVCRGVGG